MRFETRIVVLFAFLFAIAFGTRSFLSWQSEREQSAGFNSDIRNVIRVVHFTTQRFSLSKERDRHALTRFISEAVRQHAALMEISIVNINREIVASSNPGKIGKRRAEEWKQRVIEGEFHDEEALDWYEVTIPVVEAQEVIGYVQASIRLSDAAQSWNRLVAKNLIVSLCLFTLVSLASFLAIRYLGRPLRELARVAQRVAAGDLSPRLPSLKGDKELAEVGAAFNSMLDAVEERRDLEDRLRETERRAILSQTAATMAHEIRNPLNLINLTAGHLASQFVPESEEKRDEFGTLIGNLKAQVKHLNNMVNDFLAVGKPLKLRKERFPLSELTDEIEKLIRQQVAEKRMSLVSTVPADVTVFADREQARLVLLNLVLNALAVSCEGGTVSISARAEPHAATIRVCDDGPGIPEEELERIFDPYFAKRPGGTGLGLTLARRIVEEHGGHLHAENLPEGGAAFSISLPNHKADGYGTRADS